jgi:hypothetical protein
MRDLEIHGDDLIVATHGRSFWILDDLTPLRQLDDNVAKASAFLFKPQEAVRWRWNRNPDTPLPADTPAGKNPPDGAVIDYYLGAPPQTPVGIEILDASGATVRHYSSADAPLDMKKLAGEHPIPMYWVRPAQIPSATPGMHRFVWDLRGSPPKALEHEFPISAILHDTPLNPQGAWALPGRYTVRLTVDGEQFTQLLAVKMDPRIKSSLADLRAQFSLESGSVAAMNQSYETLGQVRSIRAQIKELAPKVKRKLADSLQVLDKKCATLEGATSSTFFGTPPSGKQPESLASLHQHFGQLLTIADSADGLPTTQAEAVYAELALQLKTLSQDWESVKQTTIRSLNKDLAKAKLSALSPEKPSAQEMESTGDGDDEP